MSDETNTNNQKSAVENNPRAHQFSSEGAQSRTKRTKGAKAEPVPRKPAQDQSSESGKIASSLLFLMACAAIAICLIVSSACKGQAGYSTNGAQGIGTAVTPTTFGTAAYSNAASFQATNPILTQLAQPNTYNAGTYSFLQANGSSLASLSQAEYIAPNFLGFPQGSGNFVGGGAGLFGVPANTNGFQYFGPLTNGTVGVPIVTAQSITNTFGHTIEEHLMITNNSTAGLLGIYIFQSNGVPALLGFPSDTLAFSTTVTTNYKTITLGPWESFSLTNLGSGIANVQTNWSKSKS